MQCILIFKIVLVLELLWCWCCFVLILSLICTRDVGSAEMAHHTTKSKKFRSPYRKHPCFALLRSKSPRQARPRSGRVKSSSNNNWAILLCYPWDCYCLCLWAKRECKVSSSSYPPASSSLFTFSKLFSFATCVRSHRRLCPKRAIYRPQR